MIEPFVMKGDLWLKCQEGGFAWDAWVLEQSEQKDYITQLVNATTNLHLGSTKLEDMVAQHFGAEFIEYKHDDPLASHNAGNRHIGSVRITIERLDE